MHNGSCPMYCRTTYSDSQECETDDRETDLGGKDTSKDITDNVSVVPGAASLCGVKDSSLDPLGIRLLCHLCCRPHQPGRRHTQMRASDHPTPTPHFTDHNTINSGTSSRQRELSTPPQHKQLATPKSSHLATVLKERDPLLITLPWAWGRW